MDKNNSFKDISNDKSEKIKNLELKIDPRLLAAVKMLEVSFNNSRAYADSIDTEEKRKEQQDRIDRALELTMRREAVAYWSPIAGKRRH